MDIINATQIFDRYKATFDALNARIYSSAPAEDLLLLRWWIHLSETGDINSLMIPDARRLSPFLGVFKYPTALIYSVNAANEIDNAFWASPVDSESQHRAAYCGVWCSSENRGKRRQYSFVSFVYTFAFEFYAALLGITWQSDLLALHQKLGYNIVGCIPKLHDQDFVYVVHLTREAFQASRFFQIGRK